DTTPRVEEGAEEARPEEEKRGSLWEKTEPTILYPPPQQEPVQEAPATEPRVPASMEGSFFLAEDTAADISTFLAESRTSVPEEEEEPADDFVVQPPAEEPFEAPPAVDETPQAEPLPIETPIPSPHEVENQTVDPNSGPLFDTAAQVPPASFGDTTMPQNIEPPVEEPSVEVEEEPAPEIL